jgi:D-3-phosphoglycerate dehydrogenase
MLDSRPLVVLGGPIHPAAAELLATEARVVTTTEETEAGFLTVAAEAEGILIRGRPPATASLMEGCKRLRVVGRHGVGLDTVDIPAATRLGVAVVHAPGSNSQAVAEHALMLMLTCTKRTVEIDRKTRQGDWSPRTDVRNIELGGRALGIVGVGNVGRRVATFAGAIGMRVLGYDPYVPADELRRRGVEPVATLETMLPQCDVVTFHTPLTPETHGMLGEKNIRLMKDGAIVINTSRGGVQVEHDIFEALARGKLAAAGLDVWEREPAPVDGPLFNMPNVVCSTHIAGVTVEAHRVAGLQVAGEMLRVLRGQRPEILVNPDVWPRLGQR